MAVALISIYTLALVFIFAYSLVQLHLVTRYIRFHRKKRAKNEAPPAPIPENKLPPVTVQLPVYNEMYVVERLIDQIAGFDYPKNKLQIQVLDDSTDETLEISRNKVEEWQGKGFDIQLLHRTDRSGFKAGALKEGMNSAKGEYIAIFDADFVPEPDFLKRTLPYFFADDRLGVVQTRWEHLNQDYSFLTRIQAFALDAHFTVEQQGRNAGGYFINFNGTAGVWRRGCIDDAGGWEADTLTEDLDLSYRAQIRGWRFKYLEDVTSPAELPVAMNAIKSQQFRWTKGGAETLRKNIGRIWHSDILLGQKIHGTAHLLSSLVFIFVLICSVLSVPVLWIKKISPVFADWFMLLSVFIVSMFILSIFYFSSLYRRRKSTLGRLGYLLIMFPPFLAISMGISLHNTIAVIEGLLGFKSPFIRTPKFNISGSNKSWKNKRYVSKHINFMALLEIVLCLYFLGGIVLGVLIGDLGLLPFHLMLFTGFGLVFYYTVKHTRFVQSDY